MPRRGSDSVIAGDLALRHGVDELVGLAYGRAHVLKQAGDFGLDIHAFAPERRNGGGVEIVLEVKHVVMKPGQISLANKISPHSHRLYVKKPGASLRASSSYRTLITAKRGRPRCRSVSSPR